jgi:hypothetical protein
MGSVGNQTKAALREFVYEDLTTQQPARKLQRIEQEANGGNPHNIGMAAFEYADTSAINDQTEREIKQVPADTFPDTELPGAFPENWDGK